MYIVSLYTGTRYGALASPNFMYLEMNLRLISLMILDLSLAFELLVLIGQRYRQIS